MFRRKIIEIPIYNFCLLEIIHTDDSEKLAKLFKSEAEEFENYCAFVQETQRNYKKRKNRKCISVVIAQGYKGSIHALIAHEAIHIKNRLGRMMLESWNPESDEPEAYFVEWLVEIITNFIENK